MIPAPQARAAEAGTLPSHEHGHLLVAIKDSQDGEVTGDVLAAAQLLASQTGWNVGVISVLESVMPYVGVRAGAIPPPEVSFPPETDAPSIETRRNAIRALLPAGGEPPWTIDVAVGTPAKSIADAAHQQGARMIMMGLGHHGRADRLAGAETTIRAFRHAGRPVLAVRGRWSTLPRTVVIGIDFSPASVWAAQQAARWIAPDATVYLVHAWGPPVLPPGAQRDTEPVERKLEEQLRQRMADIQREIGFPATVKLDIRISDRAPAAAILSLAKTCDADLIVVGTHGRPFFARLLLGNIAYEVTRQASTSVLMAPPPSSVDSGDIERHLRGFFTSAARGDWPAQLEKFVERNTGRRAFLEVHDPERGARVEQSGYQLLAATYDVPHDTVILTLGEPGSGAHLTRAIPNPRQISTQTYGHHHDEALRIVHGAGQTLLTFLHE